MSRGVKRDTRMNLYDLVDAYEREQQLPRQRGTGRREHDRLGEAKGGENEMPEGDELAFQWGVFLKWLKKGSPVLPLNEAEEKVDIFLRKQELEQKWEDGTITDKEMKRYWELQERDGQLKQDFHQEYNRDRRFWDQFPTSGWK